MDNSKNTRIVLGAIVVLVAFIFFTRTSFAQSFLKNLFKLPEASTPSVNQPTLYKPVAEYENAVITAVKKASPAIVSITVSKNVPILENCSVSPFGIPPGFERFFGDLPQFQGQCPTGQTQLQEVGGGSGFIVDESGYVVTNRHVVSDTAASYTVFMNDGKKYDAKVLARNPVQDIAILKIEANGLPVVTLGDSSGVELGQTSIAIGNALAEFRNTVSVGVISGLSRNITAQSPGTAAERLEGLLQTDAAINPGNSGGPLLNLRGEVIGINTAVATDAQNIGFAIPINRAKGNVESVKRTGSIEVPYVGVRYLLITPEVARQNNLSVEYGALVRGSGGDPAVMPGSPAEKAGIKANDIILEINGKRIDKDHGLGEAVSEFSVGDRVTLKILRSGREMNLDLILAKRP